MRWPAKLVSGAAPILALLSAPAGAACTVDAEAVLFGGYDTLNPAPTDGVGAVHVACDVATNVTVSLGAGGGTIQARQMTSDDYNLGYNLYTDASRFTLWGDGTTAGVTVSGSGTATNLTIYGRIPARQNLPWGEYADVLEVTVVF